MDRTAEYRDLIKRLIHDYASVKPSYGNVDVEVIADDAGGHYELWHIGWNGWERIHVCILHIDLKGGKIWIQHDGTPDGFADELMAAGIPASQIVLAFHPPSERHLTPFAVA
jgi:hypothetical protein